MVFLDSWCRGDTPRPSCVPVRRAGQRIVFRLIGRPRRQMRSSSRSRTLRLCQAAGARPVRARAYATLASATGSPMSAQIRAASASSGSAAAGGPVMAASSRASASTAGIRLARASRIAGSARARAAAGSAASTGQAARADSASALQVVVPVGQVGGGRGERDVPPVGADRRGRRPAVPLPAAAGDADQPGPPVQDVVHEDVDHRVGVAGDEVGGGRREGDVPPVAADGRRPAGRVGRLAGAGHADESAAWAAGLPATSVLTNTQPASIDLCDFTNGSPSSARGFSGR
jgi:hypothetical protein